MEKPDLIKKHKPLTKAEIEEKIRKNNEAKANLDIDPETLERNLDEFNQERDAILNPVNGKALCWVKRPTQEEWEQIIPKELMNITDPSKLTESQKKESELLTFKMMSELIVNPKLTPEEWKTRSNLVFIKLFQAHLDEIYKELGIIAENF